MKRALIALFFIISITSVAIASAGDPVDLEEMQKAGLSSEAIGRFLAQNLATSRVVPPMEAKLLTELATYGGDSLAQAYLDLDKRTAHLASRDFSPEVVEQLIKNKVPPQELAALLKAEPGAPAPMEASPAAAKPATPPQANSSPGVPPLPPTAAAVAEAQVIAAPASPGQPSEAAPDESKPAAPARQARRAPEEPGFQQLRPGQAADPGSPLPLPYSTYDIQNDRRDGQVRPQTRSNQWMGVEERELPDGHVVEKNTIGDTSVMGQEVYSRPSGHKVYRYFSGHPDEPYSGADPAQERRNREDLNTIFQK